MTDPTPVFDSGFVEGGGQMHTRTGEVWDMPVPVWKAEAGLGDQALLARCLGATLDVGCGPGRMTAALSERGVPALGLDVSPLAVAMTRSRGASALRRDIFAESPREHRWDHVLLVDGNIGIGGDPIRLLWRCRQLITRYGSVLADVGPPERGLTVTTARLVGQSGPGVWFPWAFLGLQALPVVAAAAGLRVGTVWRADGPEERWQVELRPTSSWDPPGSPGWDASGPESVGHAG